MKHRKIILCIVTLIFSLTFSYNVYGSENENITTQDTNTAEDTSADKEEDSQAENDKGSQNSVVLDIESPSVILMELNSGKVLYEKDPDTARRPASVTKLMTMLLAFEAIDSGKMSLTDTVTVSEHAASMGGSQVYLESGEQQSVEDILKCMIVSSANDAAVAMAEKLGGSEQGFVQMMNDKAAALGMNNTHFENACGLEAEGHLMSARDIGILSRELMLKHPSVTDYTTIWMDTITHHTARGDSEFGLANTNKFLKKYEGANGLKTGYTSAAGFSMSATAVRNGTTLIAVVMGSTTKDIRYKDAATLLDYGFSNCVPYVDDNVLNDKQYIDIENGTKKKLKVEAENSFHSVLLGSDNTDSVTKDISIINNQAPIQKGDTVAKVEYFQNGDTIGSVNIIAAEDIPQQQYKNVLDHLFRSFINIY